MSALAYIDSDKDTHFTGAIAQNAMELEAIDLPADWQTAKIREIVIEGISIQADQNLEWDVFIFSKSTAEDADIDLDAFVDYTNYPTTSGKQIAGAGQFYYATADMEIPYVNLDHESKIIIGLVNRSATGKNAGATGEVKIRVAARPVLGE